MHVLVPPQRTKINNGKLGQYYARHSNICCQNIYVFFLETKPNDTFNFETLHRGRSENHCECPSNNKLMLEEKFPGQRSKFKRSSMGL